MPVPTCDPGGGIGDDVYYINKTGDVVIGAAAGGLGRRLKCQRYWVKLS